MDEEVKMRNVDFDKFCGSDNGVVVRGVDQSAQSDSNSEDSATESVGTTRANPYLSGDNENRNEKINMPFIDFLGVGAASDKLGFR